MDKLMLGPRTYLDYNASAPLRPQGRAAMLAAMECSGNPSSIHQEGRTARVLVESARREVASLVGGSAKAVVFTSGGTEAANLALTPDISIGPSQGKLDVLLVGAGEHACVLGGHRFPAPPVILALDGQGMIDLAALEKVLAGLAGRQVMLALQHANNETGVIQPVAQAARLVHAHGGVVVCDAVQSAGKIVCNMDELEADLLVLSAHKLGGPKGIGAVVMQSQLHVRGTLVRGGGQESGARSGTENVAGIAGFGAAARIAQQELLVQSERLRVLRDGLEARLRQMAPEASFFGAEVARLPNTSAFAVPGISAQTLLMGLDLEGVAVSSGSACSSGKVKRSHVLDAMGIKAELAECAVRLSFGWASTQDDGLRFIEAFAKVLQQSRRHQVAA